MSAKVTHLRVEPVVYERARRLAPLLDDQPDALGRRHAPNAAGALRIAIELGLQKLEEAAAGR